MRKRITLTLTEQLAAFFRHAPGRWHDARELFPVAGQYGWRSRISDLRRSPFSMVIENRQRIVRQPDGRGFTISEYRFVPAAETIPTWELTP